MRIDVIPKTPFAHANGVDNLVSYWLYMFIPLAMLFF